MKKYFFPLLLTLLFTAFFSNSYAQVCNDRQDAIVSQIDEYVAKVRADWHIPGLSFAVIKDGKVLLSKGYGVREFGKNVPVDENSIYQIGSVSKSFTASVMASLVDEGLVSWNDTVKNILPDLDLYDDWVENNLLVKDLMTHKTGIQGQAGTYIPNLGYDREDIYQMLHLLKPAYSFRNVYSYNNITFLIASKVIEKKTGKSWEQNLRERILDPIGMSATTMNQEGFESAGEHSTIPHDFWYVKDSMYVAPIYGEEQALHWLTVIGPAGSVNSSVLDMVKWADFHINNGKVGEKQVLSKKSMDFLHRGQTIVSQDSTYIRLYGHCWYVEQNNKYKLIFHTGTTWGYTAICAFVPELKLGLMVLCNAEVPASPRYAIMRRVADLFYGVPTAELRDWNSEYLKEWWAEERSDFAEKEAKEGAKVALPAPQNLKAIVGKYTKEAPFGDAEITQKEGKLYITIGKYGWRHELTHVSGNDFSFRSDGHKFPITFTFDEKGKKVLSFEVDFNYGEDFGPWVKTK